MNKFILFVSILTLFAVVSCINATDQYEKRRLLDSQTQDSIKKFDVDIKMASSLVSHFDDDPALFLKAYNKALKWGKLNKTIKMDIKKDILSYSKKIVDELRYGSEGLTINYDVSFRGYANGTWEVKITPDKVPGVGLYEKNYRGDGEIISEQEIIKSIPKLKEAVKQEAKKNLFN